MRRAALDTNVLVSAFASRGLCADLFRYVLAEHELLVGEVVLVELNRVLAERIKVPKPTIAEIGRLLRDLAPAVLAAGARVSVRRVRRGIPAARGVGYTR